LITDQGWNAALLRHGLTAPEWVHQESLGSSLATGISIDSVATHRSAFLGSLFGSASDPSNNLLQWLNAS